MFDELEMQVHTYEQALVLTIITPNIGCLKCDYCNHIATWAFGYGEIDDYISLASYVVISGGEPTGFSQLKELVEDIRKKRSNIPIILMTNGMYLVDTNLFDDIIVSYKWPMNQYLQHAESFPTFLPEYLKIAKNKGKIQILVTPLHKGLSKIMLDELISILGDTNFHVILQTFTLCRNVRDLHKYLNTVDYKEVFGEFITTFKNIGVLNEEYTSF